jgi:hypothetical protein
MFVYKRDGRREEVHFDKITARIKKLCYELDQLVDPVLISQKVVQGVYPGVTTSELDELAAQTGTLHIMMSIVSVSLPCTDVKEVCAFECMCCLVIS